MREVTFSDINNLNISPFECIEWATEVIKKKILKGGYYLIKFLLLMEMSVISIQCLVISLV